MGKVGSKVANIVLGGAIVYLAAHAVTGRQGLVAFVDMQAQERALEQRVASLHEQHTALEARASRLRPNNLDLDYLDERARIVLAAGDGDEIVFAVP